MIVEDVADQEIVEGGTESEQMAQLADNHTDQILKTQGNTPTGSMASAGVTGIAFARRLGADELLAPKATEKYRAGSLLNQLKAGMSGPIRFMVMERILKQVEKKVLQHRECFTGFHEHALADDEHADQEECLNAFLNKDRDAKRQWETVKEELAQVGGSISKAQGTADGAFAFARSKFVEYDLKQIQTKGLLDDLRDKMPLLLKGLD